MTIRLSNLKGRPTLKQRELMGDLNDRLEQLSSEDKKRFLSKSYNTTEDLEAAWEEMKNISIGDSDNSSNHASDEFSQENESAGEFRNGSNSGSNSGTESFENYTVPEDVDFNAFDPNVGKKIKRSYNTNLFDETITDVIPEPLYSSESINNPTNPQQQAGTNNGQFTDQTAQGYSSQGPQSGSVPKEKPEPVNPSLTDADEKTKRLAAEATVDTLLNVYDKMHEWARPFAKIKERKIADLERKGLIDPEDTIPVGNGNHANARQIIEETNIAIEEVLTPDPTFHAKVRPPMIREFTKRGIGLTDMQQIGVHFGIDIASKVAGIIEVKKTLSSVLEAFKEMKREKMEYMAAQNSRATRVDPDSITRATKENDQILDDQPEYDTTQEVI